MGKSSRSKKSKRMVHSPSKMAVPSRLILVNLLTATGPTQTHPTDRGSQDVAARIILPERDALCLDKNRLD